MTLQELKNDAIEEFRGYLKEGEVNIEEPHETISEIADSQTPVYNSDILEIASKDADIMHGVPDIGPAFDGEPTPVNIAAANIYEAIEGALWEDLREWKEDQEDED